MRALRAALVRQLEDVLGADGDVVEEEDGRFIRREHGRVGEERFEREVAEGGEARDTVRRGGVERRGVQVVAGAEGGEVRGQGGEDGEGAVGGVAFDDGEEAGGGAEEADGFEDAAEEAREEGEDVA